MLKKNSWKNRVTGEHEVFYIKILDESVFVIITSVTTHRLLNRISRKSKIKIERIIWCKFTKKNNIT